MTPRRIASAATAVCVLAIALILWLCHMSFDSSALPVPPRPMTELAVAEEEYVDLLPTPLHGPSDPSQAYAPTPTDGARQTGAPDGADLSDQGAAAHAPSPATSAQPSPVASPVRQPEPEGPTQDEIDAERARRQAHQGVTDAFSGTGNSNAAGHNTDGPTGAPEGSGSDINGNGAGSVGGGWIMPRYRKVRSTLTGTVEIRAIVDAAGNPTRVEQTGGRAPAAANAALVQACIREVQAHRFTRNDTLAPPRSVATIIYRFE